MGVIVDQLETLNGTAPAPEDLPKGDIAQRLAVLNKLMSADDLKPSNGEICKQLDLLIANGGMKEDFLVKRLQTEEFWDYESDEVTSVPSYAFYGYPKIRNLSLPNATTLGSSAFQSASGLKSVSLPNAITNTGGNVFSGCTSLESVSMPKFPNINANFFMNLTSLKTVDFTSAAGVYASAFSGCTSLETVTAPNITTVKQYAFQNCSALTSLDLSKVVTIEQYAFSGSGLTSLDMPVLAQVPNYGLHYLSNVTSVNLPRVSNVGSYAFQGVRSLETLDLPLLQGISGQCSFLGMTELKSFSCGTELPSGQNTTGGTNAFQYCTNLETFNAPNMTSMSNYCLSGCSKLSSANVPRLIYIGQYGFSGCIELTTLELPAITNISASAFISSGLTTLNLYSPTRTALPVLGNVNALGSTPIANGTGYIVINDELVNTLKAASGWSNYASQIIGHTDAVNGGIIDA